MSQNSGCKVSITPGTLTLGAGAIATARGFGKTGRIGSIRSTTTLGQERQDLGYSWDVLGISQDPH